ncbi:MAG: T9SS type A sorting domain-containing protein [Salinivirgaceae bacterium]
MKKILLLPLLVLIIAVVSGIFFVKHKQVLLPKLKPFEEYQFMRNYPDFEAGAKAYQIHIRKEATRVQNQTQKSGESIPNWITQGPYNIGGRINTIAHNPGNGQIIYVGSVCGGIFKTTDGGTNWFPIFDEQAYLAISCIVVSPADTNTLFVGTGDPNVSGYPWVGDGIYKSTDAGQNWKHIGLEQTGIVSKIAVNPKNSNIVYAATMGIPFIRDANRGLYKSTDGGTSWNKVLFLSKEAGIIDMVMVPQSPDTLIVAGWDRIRNYNESIASGTHSKLYRTFNGGANWDTLTVDLPTVESSRIGLTLSLQDTLEVVAQFIDATSFETAGIFKSVNFGSNWQKLEATYTEDILGGFGWYFGKIRVNPYNKKQLFVLGVDLSRSDNGGTHFELSTPPWYTYEVHADKHDLVFIDSLTLLLSTDGGLYKSTDGGLNWNDIENIPNTQFYKVAVDPNKKDFYCGGAQDNGTSYGQKADSINWKRLFGGDGFQPLFDPKRPELIYAETQNGGLYYGIDKSGEYEWDYFENGLDESDRRSWDMPICMSKINSKIIYTGTYRIYRNVDSPTGDWEPISDDLTDGTDNKYHIISAIDVSPLTDSLIASGSSDGKVYLFDSISWRDISAGLPQRYVTCVRFSPNSKESLFVSHSGYKANENIPHLHFSENLGQTFKNISGNLPQLAINSIVVLKGYHDSVIFVATDGGIYHSLTKGQTWERTGTGMPVIPVYDLAYEDTNHLLVAGTFARSLMTLELEPIIKKYQEIIENVSDQKISMDIYPNPAKNYVIVKSANFSNGSILTIAEISGKILYTQSVVPDIENKVNISGLSKGTYLVSVYDGQKKLYTQKLLIQ